MHLVYFWKAAHRPVFGRFQRAMFVATVTALLYTHAYAMVFIAGLVCHHIFFFNKIRRRLWILFGWAVGLSVFCPFLLKIIEKATVAAEPERPASTLDLLHAGAEILTNGAEWLWIVLFVALLISLRTNLNGAAISLLVCAAGMLAALLFTNWQFNVFALTRLRYSLSAWPIFIALIAWVLTTVPRSKIFAIIFIFIWIFSGYEFYRSETVIGYTGLTARAQLYPPLNDYVFLLNDKVKSTDYLVGFSQSGQIDRVTIFSSRSVSDYYLKTLLGIDGKFLHANLKRYRLEQDVREILDAHPHILLAHDPSDVPLTYAQTLDIVLNEYIPCVVLVDEPDLHISKYTHPLMDCDNEPTPIAYENGMKIVDYVARYKASAERIQALIWWEVPVEDMLKEYNLSLQIVTPDWQNVRQFDRHLNERIVPWRVFDLSTGDLPAGEYRLMLVLYRRDNGETIAGFDSFGSESSDIIPLLTIEIQS